jgi:hypothetical protein
MCLCDDAAQPFVFSAFRGLALDATYGDSIIATFALPTRIACRAPAQQGGHNC